VTRKARYKFEKPQPGNPRRLSVKQHVFPLASIARFAKGDGRVSLYDMSRSAERQVKPDDLIFCARRAWDHRSETGYMRSIENAFQSVAEKIIDGTICDMSEAEKRTVNSFFALWCMREEFRFLDEQEIQAKGMLGHRLTKDQEECLEGNGYMFMRDGGRIPARQMNGSLLQFRINKFVEELSSIPNWGIVRARAGEFLVPDVPKYRIVPLTPTLCLVASAPNEMIPRHRVAEVNRALRSVCSEYFLLAICHTPRCDLSMV
jgi:hypothetical protein